MEKVKDFLNWSKIIFPDRTILKSDIKYLSKEQQFRLENLEVRTSEPDEDGKVILFVE